MRIALNERRSRLAVLDGDGVRLFDLAASPPELITVRPVGNAHCLAPCDDYVAVLVGEEAPSGKSVKGATLTKLTWDLEPLGSTPLGVVEKRGISLDRDGTRVAFADWASSEIAVADTSHGRRHASAPASYPTGPSWSPDGARVLAGVTGQAGGAIVLGDVDGAVGGKLALTELPESTPSPGLEDASFFTAFGREGELAVASNESWGGRGVFVYDVKADTSLWSKILESESQETDDWYAFVAAFASRDALLLVAGPGEVRGFRARDGQELGAVEVPGDGRAGFVVEQAARRIWVAGDPPTAHPFPASWA